MLAVTRAANPEEELSTGERRISLRVKVPAEDGGQLTEPWRIAEAALAQASDRIRQQDGPTYWRRDAAAPRPRPRVSQAASTDSARTLGATGVSILRPSCTWRTFTPEGTQALVRWCPSPKGR